MVADCVCLVVPFTTHFYQILSPVYKFYLFFRRFPSSLPLLYSVCQCSELCTEELVHGKMSEVLPMLHRNLSSPSSSVSVFVQLTYMYVCCYDVVK